MRASGLVLYRILVLASRLVLYRILVLASRLVLYRVLVLASRLVLYRILVLASRLVLYRILSSGFSSGRAMIADRLSVILSRGINENMVWTELKAGFTNNCNLCQHQFCIACQYASYLFIAIFSDFALHVRLLLLIVIVLYFTCLYIVYPA